MLNTVRRFSAAERYLREGRWAKEGAFPLTASLRGRRMGVLGLGRIGREIATRAQAFGVEVVYHGRKAQADAPYLYYPSLLVDGEGGRHPDGRRARRAPTPATSSTPRFWRRSAPTAC